MLILVDNELETAYAKPWGERIMAARVRIKYRLEDMTGRRCLIVRYNQITPQLIAELSPQAMFISGNSADLPEYDPAELRGIRAVIRAAELPMFGFCGGFQLLADAFGAPVTRIGRLAAGEEDPQPTYAPGWRKEFGYAPVPVTAAHPLLDGLGEAPVMRHAHTWQITTVPEGFRNYAGTAVTPIQLIIHETKPIAGSQFHPEYYTEENPDGRLLIENFCRWVGVLP
jgi:GMP synthase-like glutamine amidotransferase